MQDIGKSMARGVAWMVVGRIAEKFLGLISTFVLARLLLPEHFGVVMIASAIIAALELMGAFSFDTILIQKQDATREHYDTVWTIGLGFNLAYAVILVLMAWPAASFYNDARLVETLLVIAGTRVVTGLINIGIVDFRKNLQFKQDIYFNLARKVVTVGLTIGAAFLFRDHRALLVGMVFGAIYGTVLSYLRHPFRPRLSLSRRAELFGAAKWLFLHNILYFVNTRYADFVVAKFAGLGGLGAFNMATELSALPTTEVTMPVNRAAMSAYAKLNKDPQALEALYRKTVGATVMMTFPLAVGLAACSELFVAVVLGPQWQVVAELLPILAFGTLPMIVASNNGVVLLALAHTKAVVTQSFVRALALVLLLPLALLGAGIEGAAITLLIVNLIWAPLSHWILTRKTNLQARDFVRPLAVPIIASALMWLAVHEARGHVSADVYGLLAQVLTGAAVFVASVLIIWLARGRPDGVETMAIAQLKKRLPRRKAPPSPPRGPEDHQ